MSRGKRGTCNYKMMTFRISLRNLKYLEWLEKKTGTTKGQGINICIDYVKYYNSDYSEQEEINTRQKTLDFDE